MISSIQSKLSRLQQQSPSPNKDCPTISHILSQLAQLKSENLRLTQLFQSFRNDTVSLIGEWAGKVSHLLYRQLRERNFLQGQMEKSRNVQHTMKGEVIKLKEMVQVAVEDYEKQLHTKNKLLAQKDQEIKLLIQQIRHFEHNPHQLNKDDRESSIRIDQSRKSCMESLEIIQEESEHATHSSAALSLRDFKQDERIKVTESAIELDCYPVTAGQTSPEPVQKENLQPAKLEHKRTKTFIDHFRKTIGESFSEKNQQQEKPITLPKQLHTTKSKFSTSHSHALKELSSNEQSNKSFSQNLKQSSKQAPQPPFRTLSLHSQSNSVSKSSSSSELVISTEAEHISLPKKFQTPINLMSFKKKETPPARIMTEPSPQRIDKGNFFSKPSQSHKRIFHQKKSSCQKSHHSIEDSKSVKSLSKQKIKITAKMVEDNPKRHPKALVYLGGKSIFRKFLLQLKNALRKYTINTFVPEVKYEGSRRGNMRWGQGRAIYQNGSVYEGQFKQNQRWGRGVLTMNGIAIYEGEWIGDCISGEGYIKSMRFMANASPSVFNEASYCGNLLDNKLHGIGTLFLNSKEKIVTKFSQGVPVGELTYYNFHEIEFGVWPSE